jgi:beta-glucosidase-like glycosyl hydrolase
MSDWGATHNISIDKGLDQEMADNNTLSTRLTFKHENLTKVNQTLVDTSVTRYLESLIKVGVLDHQFPSDPSKNVTSQEHKDLARRLA